MQIMTVFAICANDPRALPILCRRTWSTPPWSWQSCGPGWRPLATWRWGLYFTYISQVESIGKVIDIARVLARSCGPEWRLLATWRWAFYLYHR